MFTIYFVEWYPVRKGGTRKYKDLMKKIHKSPCQHKRDVSELLSHKIFNAERESSLTSLVEMFQFVNQKSMNKFFEIFSKTTWLHDLQRDFFELVPRRTLPTLAWTEFLQVNGSLASPLQNRERWKPERGTLRDSQPSPLA